MADDWLVSLWRSREKKDDSASSSISCAGDSPS
jgi:hypothetical protein